MTAIVLQLSSPTERIRKVPVGDTNPTQVSNGPWPGRVPPPYPATVHIPRLPGRLVDAAGHHVAVSGRVAMSSAPAVLSIDGLPGAMRVTGWSAPWPVLEAWWDRDRSHRIARLQVVTLKAGAWLLHLDGGRWWAEAPAALSLAAAERLARAARSNRRHLLVMQNHAMDPRFTAFRDLVRSRRGPWAITADTLVNLHQPGFRSHLGLPVTKDLAVHAFDQVRQLLPAPAVDVQCAETPVPTLGAHCAISQCAVRFTDGSVFSYRGGFTTGPALLTPATGRWTATGPDLAVTWDGASLITSCPADAPGPGSVLGLGPARPGYQVAIAAMIDTLHGTTPHPRLSAESNLGTIALLDAALESAASTKSIVPVREVGRAHP